MPWQRLRAVLLCFHVDVGVDGNVFGTGGGCVCGRGFSTTPLHPDHPPFNHQNGLGFMYKSAFVYISLM